jgi:hypothetical protein
MVIKKASWKKNAPVLPVLVSFNFNFNEYMIKNSVSSSVLQDIGLQESLHSQSYTYRDILIITLCQIRPGNNLILVPVPV